MSKWRETKLVPTDNLQAWHEVEPGVTGNHIIYDTSGNNRHVACDPANAPQVQANVLNKQPAVYFPGTSLPLQYAGLFWAQHIFLVVAYDGASLANAYEGIMSALSTFYFFIGEASGQTRFFALDPSLEPYTYKKNGTVFANSNMQAPMGGVKNTALCEILLPAPLAIDGIQFGQDRIFTARKAKFWFFESLIYSTPRTAEEILRIYLHFNLKFGLWKTGLPLRFPSPDLTGILYSRFDAAPLNFAEITESHEFEDGGKTFNERADEPPRRWEIGFEGLSPAEAVIFDEFWNQARLVNQFDFLDKSGTLWQNVRIEDYERSHEAHQSKIKRARFRLVKYP
jgi:hypothetical protein